MRKTRDEIQGITLIALVVTIVVILILASVSITVVFGDNGILKLAKEAGEKTNFANEKEVIQLKMTNIKTKLVTGAKISEEEYIGEKLSEMSAVAGDWKNVIVGDKSYENGWYLLEKGNNIPDYGEANNNWLMNYESGELIQLEEGKYIVASSNASGAIVDETLKLNIDPSNLQDRSKWQNNGIKVSFIGEEDENAGSGVKETEIKFDGLDDYLKIEGIEVEKSSGITFEFYGKMYDEKKNMLSKTKVYDDDYIETYIGNFRINGEDNKLRMCVGEGDCGSELSEARLLSDDSRARWLRFTNTNIQSEKESYISFSINYKTCEIIAYQDGVQVQKTSCTREYLNSGSDIFDDLIPFTVGLIIRNDDEGNKPTFSKFDLYSCRLYSRVLTDEEISQNYIATTNYHNKLVNNN